MIVLRERNEGDVERFEDALKDAKMGIKEACEIFEDMKEQFSERRGYSERYSSRGGRYSSRDWEDDMDDMSERRYRERRSRRY
jgi:hypothetical protein